MWLASGLLYLKQLHLKKWPKRSMLHMCFNSHPPAPNTFKFSRFIQPKLPYIASATHLSAFSKFSWYFMFSPSCCWSVSLLMWKRQVLLLWNIILYIQSVWTRMCVLLALLTIEATQYITPICLRSVSRHPPGGLVGDMLAWRAVNPGSIPGREDT